MDLIETIIDWHKNTGVVRDFPLLGWIADFIAENHGKIYVDNLSLMEWARGIERKG